MDLGWTESARATGLDHFRYLIFADPQWSVQRFNVGADVSRLREGVSGAIDARDPNLGRFFDRGGKLIHYHGWADPQITPLSSTAYFNAVAAARGGVANVHQSYRLFLAPGMGHCGGGVGPNSFDALAALERWVEQKAAPDMMLAPQARGGQVTLSPPTVRLRSREAGSRLARQIREPGSGLIVVLQHDAAHPLGSCDGRHLEAVHDPRVTVRIGMNVDVDRVGQDT